MGALMEKRRYDELNAREAGRGSARTLHSTARVDEKRGLYRFVCESRPRMTLTSYGIPKRCPVCGQNYPIRSERQNTRGETNANQQG
jgi:hypothetical protein